ncbi:MAG: lactate utilization protein [Clostridiales bacterium]|nr:lactate utilization protein [Clostridiales bacterium]MCF8022030.1 lactate utilization protein [Clostridiales bacterium]
MNTNELVNWSYEQKCKKTVEALEKNNFTAVYCPTKKDAFEYIIGQAEEAKSVGFGGSASIASLGVEDKLGEKGKELLNHGKPNLSPEEKLATMRRELTSDLFLAGTNALTIDGSLVNIDANGNRVASMFFGPRKVIIVAGRNKLVYDKHEAIKRIKRNAAPPNAKRLGIETPCSKTGFCQECNSPNRICRVTTIIDRRPWQTDFHVLVVNEDMGL